MGGAFSRVQKPVVALAAAVGLLLTGASQAATKPTMFVNYTMGCTFTITDETGKAVTSIPSGDYQILVRTPANFGGVDLSGIYDMTACKGAVDFRLTGPGVTLVTSLDNGDGDSDYLYCTFAPNASYTAIDGNQPTVARATFSTTGASLSSPPPTVSTTGSSSGVAASSGATATAGTTLVGAVSSTGKLTLKQSGKAVTTLKPGLYVITVSDLSTKAGFFVQAKSKPAKAITSVAFKGKQSAALKLTKGQWFFYASSTGKKIAFAVGT